MKIGLQIPKYLGIGDCIQFAHIPENLHYYTGQKTYDLDSSWIFDHNPFIKRDTKNNDIDIVINLWEASHLFPVNGFKSHAERFFMFFNKKFNTNFINPILRHPRLYIHENIETIVNTITVHTTGKSETEPMSDEIIETINNKYSKNYTIYQIGGYQDKSTPFINKLGLSIWDTAKLISQSAVFIGVNSGMMNLANCYPAVQKKILIPRDVERFLPMSEHSSWFDHNNMFFNYTKNDIGATFSYLKI